MYTKRMQLNDALLNVFYYAFEKHQNEIKTEVISQLNKGFKNFVDFHRAPEKIVLVCGQLL